MSMLLVLVSEVLLVCYLALNSRYMCLCIKPMQSMDLVQTYHSTVSSKCGSFLSKKTNTTPALKF